MSVEQDITLKVTKYLDRLLAQGSLRLMSVDKAMLEVRQWIPEAGNLSDSDLRSVVLGYYVSHYVYRRLEVDILSPTSRASEIIDAVKKATTLAIDGVDVVLDENGKINFSIKGATLKLSGQGTTASLNIGWTGTLLTAVSLGKISLSQSLSQKGWSISLSYPKDTPILNIDTLGQTIGAGGQALAGIAEETFAMTNVKDVRSYVDRISPYIGPIADAMGAAQGIAKRPKQGLSVNVSVGSPDPSPGQTGLRGGIQGFVTLTYAW